MILIPPDELPPDELPPVGVLVVVDVETGAVFETPVDWLDVLDFIADKVPEEPILSVRAEVEVENLVPTRVAV